MKKITKNGYKKIEKECLGIVIEKSMVFMDEIFIYSEITPSEFYEAKLHESVLLKDALAINCAKLKRDLRIKWFDSTNATLNAALYKLVCTEEERRALSSSASSRNQQGSDVCTQEEYLKSLKEMGEAIENAD